MNLPIEWIIISIGVIFNCAYFSYKAGHKEGVQVGVNSTLEQLEAQGLIQLEEESEY
jgi:hypothetical protein